MDDRADRVKSIFLAAIDRHTPDEWPAFLDQKCATDPTLRADVERLLRAQDQIGSFHERSLDRVGSAAATATSLPDVDGQLIAGRYKLLEAIGEGGMGTVWMAQQQEPVKRLVAVKLIKPGMDSKQVLARFEAERQALALMDHPNIAKVFDGGMTGEPEAQARDRLARASGSGRPFFVMELVKGIPITQYCDEHHLTPRQRLELFLPVCHAIQHAHQKGIIHRDLKPSNVLVAQYDDKPVPKVIDFGVAKATGQQLTEATLHTSFGAVVGTVEYMSPEQATFNQLDIDTRSDIYSLGVLLYELLTGTTPLDRGRLKDTPLLELLRIVREDDTVRPSSRLSTIEELPSIAARRGVDSRKLSGLLRGDLDWIAMKALEKDRNRRYETASGLAMDIQRYLTDEPILACPPSAAYRLRKFARRNRAHLAVAAALGLFLLGVAAFAWYSDRHATQRQARHEQSAQAVATFLDQCEQALGVGRADRAAIALEAAERQGADGGADHLAGRLARCRADLSLLRVLNHIDIQLWTWGGGDPFPDTKAAAVQWRTALADYELTPEEGQADAAAARLNGSLIRDRLLTVLDSWLAAEPSADVRAWLRTVLRTSDPDAFRDRVRDAVAARNDSAIAAQSLQKEALDQPARFAVVLGQSTAIPPDRRRALLQSALRTQTGDRGLLMALGLTYPEKSSPAEAVAQVRWYQAALAAEPGNLAALNNLGMALRRAGDPNGAIAVLREAVRLDPNFARAHSNLGFSLHQTGDIDGAINAYCEAIRADPSYFQAHNNLGTAFRAKGNLDGAIAALNEAIRINPNYAFAHYNLGNAWMNKGDADRAVAALHESIRCDPKDPDTHYALGIALRDQRNFDGAIAAYKEAVRLDPNYAKAHFHMGIALLKKNDLDGSIKAFQEAVRANPKDADAYSNLGFVFETKRDVDSAIAAYRDAIRINPRHAIANSNLGEILCDLKRDYDGAIAAFKAAIGAKPNDAFNHYGLGNSLRGKGELVGAIASFRTALELNAKHFGAHNNLAWILATGPDQLRDGKQAVEHATRSCELTAWKKPVSIHTLAAAHAEAGDFDKAIEYQKKALADPTFAKSFGEEARERLELYARKRPYRDPAFLPREAAPPPRQVKP